MASTCNIIFHIIILALFVFRKEYRQTDSEKITKLEQLNAVYKVDNEIAWKEVHKLRRVSRLHCVIIEQIVLMYREAYNNNRPELFPLNTTLI